MFGLCPVTQVLRIRGETGLPPEFVYSSSIAMSSKDIFL